MYITMCCLQDDSIRLLSVLRQLTDSAPCSDISLKPTLILMLGSVTPMTENLSNQDDFTDCFNASSVIFSHMRKE